MNYNNIPLYSKSKTGKTLVWSAFSDYSLNTEGFVNIIVTWGQENGKMQEKIRTVKSGKNLGRSNETSLKEQVDLEIKYLYESQFDKNYFLSMNEYAEPKTPMLAHKFKDKAHKISLDADLNFIDEYCAQPKLNGVRCKVIITDEKTPMVFLSRTNKAFRSFPLLEKKLKEMFKVGDEIDGELFHPSIPFENIITLVNSSDDRSITNPLTEETWESKDIQYHVYDIIPVTLQEASFKERFYPLLERIAEDNLPVSIVPTTIVKNFEEVKLLFKAFMVKGFEGLMFRKSDSKYEYGIRSLYLLKYKEMEQEEFLISDIYLAENDPSKVMFTLSNHHATTKLYSHFDCALKGNKDDNLLFYTHREDYLLKYLTVDYQVLSKYNVPLFPVGIVIRDGAIVDGIFKPSI